MAVERTTLDLRHVFLFLHCILSNLTIRTPLIVPVKWACFSQPAHFQRLSFTDLPINTKLYETEWNSYLNSFLFLHFNISQNSPSTGSCRECFSVPVPALNCKARG